MTVISSTSSTSRSYTSAAMVVGDVVVLTVARQGPQYGQLRDLTQDGWFPVVPDFSWSLVAGGGATGSSWTNHAIWWKPATSTAPLTTGDFIYTVTFQAVHLRGVTGLEVVELARINAAPFTFPALAFGTPMTGHVLYLGVTAENNSQVTPATGATQLLVNSITCWGFRNMAGQEVSRRTRETLSEKPITAVTSVAAVASTPAQRVDGWAISMAFTTVSGPLAPTILAPEDGGTQDLAASFPITWVPQGPQTGYAIRRKLGAGAWAWWNGTTFGAATETIIASTATTLTVPAGQFTNGAGTYTIEVATKGDLLRPSLGLYGSTVVVAKAAPTLSTFNQTPQTGGNTITSFTPTLTVSGSAGAGGTLTGYRAWVDQDLGAGWVTRLDLPFTGTSRALTVAEGKTLSNGSPIRFRAVAVQDGSQWSNQITSNTFTLGVTRPATPTVVVTQVTEGTSGLPGLRATVTSSVAGAVVVYRNGVQIYAGAIAAGVPLLVDDYTPGPGAVTYSATVTTGDDVTTVKNTSLPGTGAGTAVVDTGWLVNPMSPELAVKVFLQEEGGRTHGTRTSVYQPISDDDWAVHTGGRVKAASEMTIATLRPAETDKALSLLTSGALLELRMMAERDGLGSSHYVPPIRFRVSGDVAESRVVQRNASWRFLSFPYVEQVS